MSRDSKLSTQQPDAKTGNSLTTHYLLAHASLLQQLLCLVRRVHIALNVFCDRADLVQDLSAVERSLGGAGLSVYDA